MCWGSTIPITLVWSKQMGPLGDPLAQQPRGTPGGAQDSSMSSPQSNRKSNTQLVPSSSTQLTALFPSIVCQARHGHTTTCPSGNKQGFFHTWHPCVSYSYTVTDVLGGLTKLPWESICWMKKSPSPRNSNERESHLPLAQTARRNKTPSLLGQ